MQNISNLERERRLKEEAQLDLESKVKIVHSASGKYDSKISAAYVLNTILFTLKKCSAFLK